MAVDTIYTVAGGAWFQDTLNGVAAFFNSRAGDSLIAMATAVSVIVGAATYIRTRNIMDLVKWAGFYVLVIAVLVGDKRHVQIIDLSEPAAIYQVDNVPTGLAAPASLITRIGAGMAQVYDFVFARPDALTYSKTGMLFGAQLAAGSSDFRFSEPEIQRMFSDYVHNCVVGDIMLNNKYSIGDLMNSTDPYALIFSKPSPLRGLYDKNRNFLTCEQASTKINTDSGDISGRNMFPFLQQVLNRMHGFTNQVFGPTNGASTALFTAMLGDSYSYFHGTSLTSTEIIRKNVVMNGLRSGLESFSAQNGDTAGLVNVATQTSMAKMRLSQATSASIAANTLPVMHSVLLGMTMALFPVLIVLSVVSSLSWTIIKGYIYTITYLQMWPILFSILNHAMNFYLQGKLNGTAVTLATFDQVQNTYSDIGTTAGWLALSIPFIAWGMVKGLGQVVSQAGNYLGQTLQSASTQSSSQAIDGNWSYNNMTTGNVQGARHSNAGQTAHDLLHQKSDHESDTGNRLLATASRLDKTALGRRVLAENGLEGETMARFIAAGKKYPSPYVALPAWTRHGKAAGALLTEIRIEDDGMRVVLSDESRLRGGEDAQFAGLQASRNGQTLIADDAQTALRLAQENPESGVVIRLHGEERLLNAARLTGGRITEPDEVERTVRSVAEAESAAKAEDPITLPPDEQQKLAEAQEKAARALAEHARQELLPALPGTEGDKPDPLLSASDERRLRDGAERETRELDEAVREAVAEGREPRQQVREQRQRTEREWVVNVPEKEIDLEKTLGGD
ncbi:conjugal transfer mating pair stabilization protein TraG [Salmonella enterica subsp. enterica serovar Newport]|nr:conjugal transfer mating pair stabilization protein TraG [Salmonella enterica subsp. enterica serovar Newport]